jgi:multidrug resistance efflux pump
MKRWMIVGVVVLAAAAAAALLLQPFRHSSLVYSGTVETREIQIGSKVGGRVTAVGAEEGDQVDTGTMLVRFECDELKAQRGQAQARVDQAKADLQRLERGYRPEEIAQAEATMKEQRARLEAAENGPRPQELAQAQADYDAAKADAVNAEATYKRMQTLVQKDIVSRQQFDDAKAKRDASEKQAESARQRLAVLQAGTRKEDLHAAEERFREAKAAAEMTRRGYRREDIQTARGRLTEAEHTVEELDARLREAELTAPAKGVIEVVSVRPGDLVAPGRIVISMLESSQLWVKVYVPETDLAKVRLNDMAAVEVDSLPGRPFTGYIEQIASQSEFLPRNVQTRDDREHQVFGVKVRVRDADANGVLKSGMAATVRLK